MELFQYEQLCMLNESEFSVYNYVSVHMEETERMNIRELSEASGMSTTTVLRFCRKMGCSGFTELKYKIRKALEEREASRVCFPSVMPAIHYLQKAANNPELDASLEKAAGICLAARETLLFGIGGSGSLCGYGAWFLTGAGIVAHAITDPFFPMPRKSMEDTAVIVLSVSGETPEVVFRVNDYKKKKARIISITNTDYCTIAKLSELNFAYYMPLNYSRPELERINLTTQLPALYLLEALMQHVYQKKQPEEPGGGGAEGAGIE